MSVASHLFDRIIEGLLDTSPPETAAVILGLAYSVLAARQNRWCWVAGGISSSIFVYLFAVAHLPMQSILNAYYVAMGVYGWFRWSQVKIENPPIGTWPLRNHLIAVASVLIASVFLADWLAQETQAAWPYLDSATTGLCFVATWLTTRMKLESWLYWIAADTVLVFLSGTQGLMFSAFLYLAFLCVSSVGFFTWLRKYRLQPSRSR